MFYKDVVSWTMDLFFSLCANFPYHVLHPFTVKYTFLLKMSVFIAVPLSTPCIGKALHSKPLLEPIKTDKMEYFPYKR